MPDAIGLPEHLRGELDISIQQAELDYLRAKRRAGTRWGHEWNQAFIGYLRKVFFTFTSQARKAGDEGVWTVDQIRQEVKAYSRKLVAEQYAEKWPGPEPVGLDAMFKSDAIPGFEQNLRELPMWADFQKSLLSLATRKHSAQSTRRKAVAVHAPDLGKHLDEAVAELDVKHEELARRIGIGRTTYFAVKAGGGKRSTRIKVERWIAKHLPTVT